MRYAVRMTGYTDSPRKLQRLLVAHGGWHVRNPWPCAGEVGYDVAFDDGEAANAFSADMERQPVVERRAKRSRFRVLLSACLRYHA